VNALKFGRNGWATLVAPGDIDAVHTVHMSTTGTVTVWHRTRDGYEPPRTARSEALAPDL
jgi:hypothetical protein